MKQTGVNKMQNNDCLMTEAQLAEFLNSKRDTLRYWRLIGQGPKFLKLGPKQVRYRMSDVNEWLDRHVYQSTAELANK